MIIVTSTLNTRPAFSNSSGLKSVSEELRFRDGLSVDNRPNRIRLPFFISPCVVWGPECQA